MITPPFLSMSFCLSSRHRVISSIYQSNPALGMLISTNRGDEYSYKLCKGRFFLSSNKTDQTGWNSNELEWNHRCIDFIVKKASKKLYSLRILCRAGVAQDNILKVYLSTVRPVLACCLCMAGYFGPFIPCNRGSPNEGFEDYLPWS